MITINDNIKSVRLFEKVKKINIDYYTLDGKRHRFSTGIVFTKKNMSALERQKLQRAQAHYEANLPSNGDTLFKDIALEALRSTADDRALDTQLDYEGLLECSLLPAFSKMAIGDIKPRDIEKWKRAVINIGISKSRFHKHWTTLGMILKYCAKNDLIIKDPMQYVSRSSKSFKVSKDRSTEYYTPPEVSAILKHTTGWFRAFIHTLFLTGMRTGEALALQWSHIDFTKRVLNIEFSNRKGVLKETKTGKSRNVDMSSLLYDELLIYYNNKLDERYVFPSTKDHSKLFYEPKTIVEHHLKPLLKELDIEYKTLYATRHSFASNLVLNNVPITYVQKMLGHSKLTTTMDFYVKNGLIDSSDMAPLLDNLYSA